jgi:hypothetical protein
MKFTPIVAALTSALTILVWLVFALALPAGASAFISTGDGGWFWQNPLPQGNPL